MQSTEDFAGSVGPSVAALVGTMRARDDSMHPLLFEMKQSHLGGLRLQRSFAETRGLTPARVDLLRAIVKEGGECPQSVLPKRLCVTRPVVSIMVRSLERLGFVSRESCADRRTRRVTLTPLAVEALRAIAFPAIREAFIKSMITEALDDPTRGRSPTRRRHSKTSPTRDEQLRRVAAGLEGRLAKFRAEFALGSHNPWAPSTNAAEFFYADVPENPLREDIVPTQAERMLYARHAPAAIEDEEFPYSVVTGRPMWPTAIAMEMEAAVLRRRAAISKVEALWRAHARTYLVPKSRSPASPRPGTM